MQTFADPEVGGLIEKDFVVLEVNVDHERETAAWFRGKGIPDT